MALKTVLESLKRSREEYEKRNKELGTKAQEEIVEAIAELLPDGMELMWGQWTPYFADGEPCVFSVHTAFLRPEGSDEQDEELYGTKTDLGKLWNNLSSDKNSDIMLAAFGDHAEVIVKKNGKYKRSSYNDHD